MDNLGSDANAAPTTGADVDAPGAARLNDVIQPYDKDRFEALMRLADFHFRTWDSRRQHEQWTLSLAFWGILGAAGVYLPASTSVAALIAGAVLMAFVYGRWLLNLVRSNHSDREREQAARLSALQYVEVAFKPEWLSVYKEHDDTSVKIREKQRTTAGLMFHWAVWPAWVITLIVMVASAWTLHERRIAVRDTDNTRADIKSLQSTMTSIEARIANLERTLPSDLSKLRVSSVPSRLSRVRNVNSVRVGAASVCGRASQCGLPRCADCPVTAP